MSIMIRAIMKNARSTASHVMVMPQKETITWVPSVKNRFRIPVNTTINSTGFIPRVMAFSETLDNQTLYTRNANTSP